MSEQNKNILDLNPIFKGDKTNIDFSFEFTPDCNCVENAGNDLISETDARGNKTYYTVDEDTSRNEEVTDRLGNKTAYEYDDSGRTTKVTSKDAAGTELANVSYAYDTFDNMTEIVRGDGMKYALAYNEFHNLESIGIEGKSEALIKYAYKNGNGRLKQMTYANGHTMKAVYNSIGQMVAEKWFETEAAAASSTATPIAHYKYVYDGDGNIVRSIDISGKKEYNYEYEEGRIVRATEANIELLNEIVTSKVIVNTVKYYYDTEGKMTKKVITPASGSTQTFYYETNDDNTVVKFSAGGRTVTSHSKTDSFGRKVFDELQLGTDFVSRQFVYHAGKVTAEHKGKAKVKSSVTTQLVSQIILSNGITLSYGYDAEERITSVVETYTVDETPVTNITLYTYDALGQLLTEANVVQTIDRLRRRTRRHSYV
jgi:YD repeat-containing protein